MTVGSESHSFFANGFLVHNCDDHFHVEYLKDMLKAEKVYGILSLDSNEAGIGILSGDRLDIEDLMTSGISGKTRKGGQSARRYERGREMELTYFFNRVSEHVTRIFITDHNVGGIIVGGPGPTKENFLNGGYLHYRLQNNIIEVIDISYSGREGHPGDSREGRGQAPGRAADRGEEARPAVPRRDEPAERARRLRAPRDHPRPQQDPT